MSFCIREFLRRTTGPILALGALTILAIMVGCQSAQAPPQTAASVNLAPIEFRLTALESQAAYAGGTRENVALIEQRVTELESHLATVAGQLTEVKAITSRTDQQLSTLRDSIYYLPLLTPPPAFIPEEQSAHEDDVESIGLQTSGQRQSAADRVVNAQTPAQQAKAMKDLIDASKERVKLEEQAAKQRRWQAAAEGRTIVPRADPWSYD